MRMLELKNIRFETGGENSVVILQDVNLTLQDKRMYAVTGPNGSGKSSLAKIIMGIMKPTSGKVFLDGGDITETNITERARMGIGYAFQNPPKFKGIKVKDMLALSAPARVGYACDKLYNVGLCSRDYLSRDLDSTLSGGEMKRIEIATVLSRNLKLAIFDEPEAGIDLWSFQKLAETFMDMHEQTDTTILIISHQERILSLADEIILMSHGTVRQNVPKEEILVKGVADERCLCRTNCERKEFKDAECVG
jgi:Fe-S cluster assembly ATP-binding protein